MNSILQKKSIRRFLAQFFIFLVLFSTSAGILMRPQKAEAQWVVWDAAVQVWDTIKQEIFPIITDTVKIFVIQFVYQDILDWISGAKDKPAFITDFDEWLFQSADIAVSNYLEDTLGDAFTVLCTGIDVNLALYWKKDYEHRYEVPECKLSEVAARFENPGTQWVDFGLSYEDANSDTSYLFTVWELSQEKKTDSQVQQAIEAVSGNGFVVKENGKIKTPGAVVQEYVNDALGATIGVQVNSEAWASFVEPLINAATVRLMREGINQFNEFQSGN